MKLSVLNSGRVELYKTIGRQEESATRPSLHFLPQMFVPYLHVLLSLNLAFLVFSVAGPLCQERGFSLNTGVHGPVDWCCKRQHPLLMK